MSLPCGAPRTARSTASVSGRSRSSPSRTPGGGSFTFGRPWASMQGCISKPGAGVGAQGAVVGRGEDDRAAAAAAGVLERALEQRAADPARLVVGQHHEQRQPPHALAVDGKRPADHLPVLLGHPCAARIGLDQVGEAHQRRVRRRRRRGRVVEARLEIGEGHHGDVVDGAGVLVAHGSDRRHGGEPYARTPGYGCATSFLAWPGGSFGGAATGGWAFLAWPGGSFSALTGFSGLGLAASRPDRPAWPDPAAPSPPWPAWAASRPDRAFLAWPGGVFCGLAWPRRVGLRLGRLVRLGLTRRGRLRRVRGLGLRRPGGRGAPGLAGPPRRAVLPGRAGRSAVGVVDTWRVADPTAAAAAGAACALRSAARGSGTGWCVASTPAVVPPPTSATVTSALAASAPEAETAAAPPPAEPEPNAAPSAASLSPTVGITGSATASVLRCSATSSRNARQPAHSRRCRCSVVRRSAPPRRFGDLLADLLARRLARLAAGRERRPRLEHQRLHLLPRHVQHERDLVVGDGPELGQHERGALLLGQARDVAEQVAHVLAPLRLGREVLGGRRLVVAQRALAAGAQHREAAVAGDRVEPRPQLDLRVAAPRGGGRRP